MDYILVITMYKRDNYRHHWKEFDKIVSCVGYELIDRIKSQNYKFIEQGGKVESRFYSGFTRISEDRLLKTVYKWQYATA